MWGFDFRVKKFRGKSALMAGKFITIIYNEKKKKGVKIVQFFFFQTFALCHFT